MNDFIAASDKSFLERQGLAGFEPLWALQLSLVDDPNVNRGGWSHVSRLELEGQAYYLKRQCNHLTRSLKHPFGTPTLAHEFSNIMRYRELGVSALSVAFYAERKRAEGYCAILLTRALDGWHDLKSWFGEGHDFSEASCDKLFTSCGHLICRLHDAGFMHGCLYPQHVFAREAEGDFEVCLIDLEKTRPLWLGRRDRIKDMEQFIRYMPEIYRVDVNKLLAAYLDCSLDNPKIGKWRRRIEARRRHKE